MNLLKKASKRAEKYWEIMPFADNLERLPRLGNFTAISCDSTGVLLTQSRELIKVVLYYELLVNRQIKQLSENEVRDLASKYLEIFVDVNDVGKVVLRDYPEITVRDYLHLHAKDFADKMLLGIYAYLVHHFKSVESLDEALMNYEDHLPV